MRVISLALGLTLGATGAQVPEFAQQYAQRLGGAIDELEAIATDFDLAADRAGLTREEGLERYDASGDSFLAGRGLDMRGVFDRLTRLRAHQDELAQNGPLGQAATVVTYFDPQLAARTAENYRPGLPVTAEGIGFAGAGLLGGYGIGRLFGWLFRRRRTPSRA